MAGSSKRCKKQVVNGLKCVNCDNIYHNSCAKLMNNMKFIDDCNIACCDNANDIDDDEAFFNAMNNVADSNGKVDVQILKYIVKQKDSIIHELKERITSLTQRFEERKCNCDSATVKAVTSSDGCVISEGKSNYSPSAVVEDINPPRTNKGKVPHRANIISEVCDQPKLNWAEVVKKGKQKSTPKPVLCGVGTSGIIKVIKKEPRGKAILVIRFAPELTVTHISDHLSEMNLNPCKSPS